MVDKIQDLFLDDTTKPESAWFNFENVGDTIQGELVLEPYERDGKFGKQTCYNIKDSGDKEWIVALKNTSHKYVILQARTAEVGDIMAFRFIKEVDTGKLNPAKSIEVRVRRKVDELPA